MQQKVLDSRYELDRKIGEGGMARIYAGRDLRLNRRVAIKIPHRHNLGDPDFLERFRHEAQAAAMLMHPNIVDVYDVGQDGDLSYIVMEFVEGTDLKTIIQRGAPLPVAQAVRIAEQIAQGLQAAHQAGMVHRDIKPQNVIVTPEGRARVTDFGVAKSHLSTALTETGVSFGTVDYISPEQAQGRPALPQSDIYALGVVLFEMLTGRLPFGGDNAVGIAMKHVAEPPPRPRSLNPQIPVGLEALVLRMLSKDPAARPASAAEVVRLLAGYEQLAQQETLVNAPMPQPAPRPQPGPQRPGPQPQRPASTGATGRVIPAPRSSPARAPRQEGVGCGVFLVGMLILAGVLGLVLLFSTGALSTLFAGGTPGPRPTAGQGGVVDQPSVTPEQITPSPENQVAAPSLVGQSAAEAERILRELQLTPVRQEQNSAEIAIGLVISQAVPPETPLRAGDPLTYTVSLGPVLVAVPDVVSQPAANARGRIELAGLVPVVVEEPSASVDAGFVIGQSPRPGLQIPQGDQVTLRVSLGDVVRFPNVIGSDRFAAEAAIAGTGGLLVNFVDQQGPDRLANFESFAPNEVVSAAIVLGNGELRGISNGEYIPRGSQIVLGVRAP